MKNEHRAPSVAVVSADDDFVALVEQLIELDPELAPPPTAGSPDAVVVDVGDDEVDGFGVLRQLRNALPGACIVACSPFPDPVSLLAALDAGADHYIGMRDLWREVLPALHAALAERSERRSIVRAPGLAGTRW